MWRNCYSMQRMGSMKSADLIGHIKFLLWRQLDGCSVTRPFLSLWRVWLVRLGVIPHKCTSLELAIYIATSCNASPSFIARCTSELQLYPKYLQVTFINSSIMHLSMLCPIFPLLGRWWGLYGDLTDYLKDESPVISLLFEEIWLQGLPCYRGNWHFNWSNPHLAPLWPGRWWWGITGILAQCSRFSSLLLHSYHSPSHRYTGVLRSHLCYPRIEYHASTGSISHDRKAIKTHIDIKSCRRFT